MFVVYPQATQTQHTPVDPTHLTDFVWEISVTGPKYSELKYKNTLPNILGASCVNF